MIKTRKVQHKFPFVNSFVMLEYIFNPAERCKKVWKKGCRAVAKRGGEMRRFTRAKVCRGE